MIPAADAITATTAMIAGTATIATIKTTISPAMTAMFIGMTPITAGKAKMKIAETITAHPGARPIVPATAFIKNGLAMTKEVPAVPALAIPMFKKHWWKNATATRPALTENA